MELMQKHWLLSRVNFKKKNKMDIIYHLVKWHPTANIEIGEKYTAVRYEYNGAFSAVLVFSVEPKKGFSIPTQGTFDELIKHYSK